MTTHTYTTTLSWDGSTGQGYRRYSRDHRSTAPPAHAELQLSADASFGGDADRLNPEQLLVMAASSCQLLSFLSEAAQRGLDILGYTDRAEARMDDSTPLARIDHITLRPRILVTPGLDPQLVLSAAHDAHQRCYIANSLTSPVQLDIEVDHA